MSAKPTVVCLCGSTRFFHEFQVANFERTMAGEIVLSVGFYAGSPDKMVAEHGEGVGITPEEKIALDELHKRKIDLADYVYVINPGGYIGESTASEIHYAYQRGKPVVYQVEPPCDHSDLDCPPGPCDRFYPPLSDRGRDG